MQIHVKSIVKNKEPKVFSKVNQFKLFKPFKLPCALYLFENETEKGKIEFEYKSLSTRAWFSFDDFMYEIGFVMVHSDLIEYEPILKKAYEYLVNNKMNYGRDVNYADKSNEAVLARKVLKIDAHCDKYTFKSLAFDFYFDLGFSKNDFKSCVRLYA